MSLIFYDLTYLGIKGVFYLGKFVGISSYNIIAYIGGYNRIQYFPPTNEELLLIEVKNLKEELINIKKNIQINQYHNKLIYEIVDKPIIEDCTAIEYSPVIEELPKIENNLT